MLVRLEEFVLVVKFELHSLKLLLLQVLACQVCVILELHRMIRLVDFFVRSLLLHLRCSLIEYSFSFDVAKDEGVCAAIFFSTWLLPFLRNDKQALLQLVDEFFLLFCSICESLL